MSQSWRHPVQVLLYQSRPQNGIETIAVSAIKLSQPIGRILCLFAVRRTPIAGGTTRPSGCHEAVAGELPIPTSTRPSQGDPMSKETGTT